MTKFLSLFLAFLFSSFYNYAQYDFPQKKWFSYFGGQLTTVTFIEVDTVRECIVIAGQTADSVGIATFGADKESIGSLPTPLLMPEYLEQWMVDGFIAKFDLEGNLIWGTYIGGENKELIYDMVIDIDGNIIVGGATLSKTGIATEGAFVASTDASYGDSLYTSFICKFNPDGEKVWGTYIGFATELKQSWLSSISTDNNGSIYVLGTTNMDSGIATTGIWQDTFPTVTEQPCPYILKFDENGSRLWGTYYGKNNDGTSVMCVDGDDNLIIVSTIRDADYGTSATFLPTPISDIPISNPIITKFSEDGERLWCTYLPFGWDPLNEGEYIECVPLNIVCDNENNIYLLSRANSQSDYLFTEGAWQSEWAGDRDAVLSKFDPSGNRIWSTYFGGEKQELSDFASILEPATAYAAIYGGEAGFKIHNTLTYSPNNGGAIYFGGITYSTSGIEHGCSYTPITEMPVGFFCKFDLEGQFQYSSYFDAPIYGMSVLSSQNSKETEVLLVGRTVIDSLGTPGAFKEEKSDLPISGYFTSFVERCPTIELNIIDSLNFLIADDGFETYYWYKDDVLITTTSEPILELTTIDYAAIYYCAVNKCICQYKSNNVIFHSAGLDNFESAQEIVVYPSPVRDILFVKLPQAAEDKMKIVLTDAYGREVWNGIIQPGMTVFSIPTEGLSLGTYWLKVQKNNQWMVTKFVKL